MQWDVHGAIAIDNNPFKGGYNFVDPRVLPCLPIWPGFAINTIFYAAILSGGWLPFAALLGVFRRRGRIMRGLCAKCGYDLRGGTSETCPECGRPTHQNRARQHAAVVSTS